MYDLLNTQACLSRQKEHLRLPERHLTSSRSLTFQGALCEEVLGILGSHWNPGELRRLRAEDVQSIAEDAQHLRALGTVDQTLGDAILSLGSSWKMISLLPCCLGAALTFFCAHAAAWLFAVEENQNLTRSVPWAPLCSGLPLQCHQLMLCSDVLLSASEPQPISLFSCGLLLRNPTTCVSVLCMNMLWTRQVDWWWSILM